MENLDMFRSETSAFLSDIDKLFLIQEYINFLITEQGYPEKDTDFVQFIKEGSDADIVFKYISDLYQYGEFPQIVSNKNYKNLNKPQLFRSSNNFNYLANTLVDFDRYYGWGLYSNGLYSADTKKGALHFHSHVFNHKKRFRKNKNIYMEFKVDSDKIIKLTNLINICKQLKKGILTNDKILNEKLLNLNLFLKSIPSDNVVSKEFFEKLFANDPSKLAIILGFDALVLSNEFQIKSIAVLNRGKMILPESEFVRVLSNSNTYASVLKNFDFETLEK